MTAPGSPGVAPTWSSSAKDLVTTALGPGRLWATLGHGIVNEVYWPSTGRPQLRDLGFLVVGPQGWWEVKRVNRYRLTTPAPHVPLPTVVHDGPGYRLELEIVPDPLRDVLLIRYRLHGDDVRALVLAAPHLGPSSGHDDAWTDGALFARGGDDALCLASDAGFARASAGYVGASDGWQDLDRHGAMTWTYPAAPDGNVALTGELPGGEGVLALGFASSPEGAATLCRSSLATGFAAARRRFVADWESWGGGLDVPDAPGGAGAAERSAAIRHEAILSATVLKVHEDRAFPGAVVASLSVPWGNARDDLGGYHLVWARDAVEAGFGLLAAGQIADARTMLAYLIATQDPDGHWAQNFFPDGRPFWRGVQLDETGLPVLLAAKLAELDALDDLHGVREMVRRASGYLARHGPSSPQDRWEENAGISPFTLAVTVAALVAAGRFLGADAAGYAASLADAWNERIEDWTYVAGDAADPEIVRACGVDGYYLRIAAPPGTGLRGRIEVRNRSDGPVEARDLVSLDYQYLARLGLRRADDPRMRATHAVVEARLALTTPCGPSYHRYDHDGYGEHDDGSPFDGSGVGRAWPLLTGERGHLALQLGDEPAPYLEAMTCMTGPGGLLPEQVWDGDPLPEAGLRPGKPTGSAMPLVWAHAEFLKLVRAAADGQPLELLNAVAERYHGRRPQAATWHWRSSAPFDAVPAGRALLVEADRPFALHAGFDGWREVRDLPSRPLGLGMHGVRLTVDALSGRSSVEFTRRDPASGAWEGEDHRVTIGAGG